MSMLLPWEIGPSILMYHSIADNSDEPFTVTVDDFRKQISWLYEEGFEVVSLLFLLKSIRARDYSSLRKKVVITFDDGFKDFVTNALPVLQDHGATATVFLVTAMLGGKGEWTPNCADVPLMTEDEVRQIKKEGISLGSHTATHIDLKLADHEDILKQLIESRDIIARLGETFYSLAYPWGQWSPAVANAVKSTGFQCALAVGEQTRFTTENIYKLPRISVGRDMSLKRFQLQLNRTNIEKDIRRQYRKLREIAA